MHTISALVALVTGELLGCECQASQSHKITRGSIRDTLTGMRVHFVSKSIEPLPDCWKMEWAEAYWARRPVASRAVLEVFILGQLESRAGCLQARQDVGLEVIFLLPRI